MSEGAVWILVAAGAIALALAAFSFGRRAAITSAVAAASRPPSPAEMVESLRPAFEAMPDAALLIDGDGRVALRNRAAADLTGAVEGRPLAGAFRVPDALQAVERV